MMQIKSILCPVDFSEFSVHAYDYARSLAWHYKATLFLQHVLYPLYGGLGAYGSRTDSYGEACQRLHSEAQVELQWFADKHRHGDPRPQCVVQDGSVTDTILSFAGAQSVDLIVMGTHGLRGIDRLMLGSVTERVLRRARCPVLAVRKPAHHVADAGKDPEPIRIRRIVLCSDFSDHAHRASQYAVSMAKEYRAELVLLHVLEEFPRSQDYEVATTAALTELDQSVPCSERDGCGVNSIVRVGKPYQQIIQFAIETQPDVVVMGVRGRGALDVALFGSTTYRVIQLGSCPVLAVHI